MKRMGLAKAADTIVGDEKVGVCGGRGNDVLYENQTWVMGLNPSLCNDQSRDDVACLVPPLRALVYILFWVKKQRRYSHF